MGVVATRAIETRRRGTVGRIDRLIAERDAKDPLRVARSQRIKAAARDARRALRARAAADRTGQAAAAHAGAGVRRLLDEGLSISDAAVLLDIPRSAAKRLGRLTDSPGLIGSVEQMLDSTDNGVASSSDVRAR